MNKLKNKQIRRSKSKVRFSYIYLLFSLLIIGSPIAYAQTAEIDSLHALLADVSSDSERLPLMNALISELIGTDLKQAILYSQKALDLSRQIADREQEAIALNNMGLVLYQTADRESSLEYFEKSESMASELGLQRLHPHILMSIARYHRYVSYDSTKTVNNLTKSIEVSKATNYDYGIGRSYAKLASFYTKYNKIALSEEYLELSAKYYTRLEDGARIVAHYYNEVADKIWSTNPKKAMNLYLKGKEYADTPNLKVSLAKAYSYIGDYETALDYLEDAIPYFRKTEKTRRMLGIAIAQLAEVYIKLGDYQAANKNCDEGIELLTPLGRSDQRALPTLYRAKGIIADHKGNDKAALEYYTKSYDEAVRIKFRFERIKIVHRMGLFYSSRDPEKGKDLCKRALKEAKKTRYTNLEIEACNCLYNIHKNEKSFENALEYYEQKTILTDSLSALNVEHALDINSKIAKKDQQIAEQAYQKEIKEEQLKNQKSLNNIFWISSFFGLMLIGFLTLSYKRISRQNKEINEKTDELETVNKSLEQSNQELERFAHIASHDLKSPLNTIISFTGMLRFYLKNEQNPKIQDPLNFIENSGKRMHQLIEDILEYSKLSGHVTREQEVINLNQLVTEIAQLTQNTTKSKSTIFEVSELPSLKWYYSKVFLLFKNIIENGIKYNQSEEPIIKVYCTNKLGINTIYIEDNGIGIEKEYFEKIFVMFNRLHNNSEYEGTGLGLATCKKIADEFEGKISISSEINKGTTFKIELPKHLIHHPADTELMEVAS